MMPAAQIKARLQRKHLAMNSGQLNGGDFTDSLNVMIETISDVVFCFCKSLAGAAVKNGVQSRVKAMSDDNHYATISSTLPSSMTKFNDCNDIVECKHVELERYWHNRRIPSSTMETSMISSRNRWRVA